MNPLYSWGGEMGSWGNGVGLTWYTTPGRTHRHQRVRVHRRHHGGPQGSVCDARRSISLRQVTPASSPANITDLQATPICLLSEAGCPWRSAGRQGRIQISKGRADGERASVEDGRPVPRSASQPAPATTARSLPTPGPETVPRLVDPGRQRSTSAAAAWNTFLETASD
jgi:hypothetical protein